MPYVVTSGETASISSGQTSSSMTVLSGGALDVLSGGTVVNTTVLGSETILGTGRQTTVYSGASQTVSAGGLALNTTIQSGGSLIVSAGGTATSAVVNGFRGATVLSGGIISNSYVSGVGVNTLVISGGQAIGTTVGGGTMLVSGVVSTSYGATLDSNISTVITAASAIGTLIQSGELDVDFGGSTTGTVVLSNASPYASPSELVDGGTATGTRVESGAQQEIYAGTAIGTEVMSGGRLGMITGGMAMNAVVVAGGTVSGAGGMLVYAEAPGVETSFIGSLVGSLTLVQSGAGTLALAGATATFSGTALIGGGTLELASAGAAGSATLIGFAPGTSGTLRVEGSAALTTPVSGLNSGDTIDLTGLAFTGNTTVAVNGDVVTVTEGGIAETLTVRGASDGALRVADDGLGGTALTNDRSLLVVLAGQTVVVGSGQASDFVAVLSGGMLDVEAGGTVTSAAIQGSEVLSGGIDQVGIVSSGGLLTVASGGQASGTVVQGSEVVLPGGVAIRNTVLSGVFGQELVLSGGSALATTVSSRGYLTVAGSSVAGTGALQTGNAALTIVSAGGTVIDMAGGNTTGTVLLGNSGFGGAIEYVSSGATATGTMVMSGATQSLFGGTAVGTIVAGNGTQAIGSGTAINTTALAGSVVLLDGLLDYTEAAGVTSSFAGVLEGFGTLVQSGPGTLALPGTLGAMGMPGTLATFSGTAVISGGTLELTSVGSGGSASINFATSAGTLRIDGTTGPGNTISGFASGDLIDLAGLSYAGTATPRVQGNTVTIAEGSLTETLLLAGASLRSFRLSDDGAGGTDMQIACYAAGTQISTVRGDVPVDDLAIGCEVITVSGDRQSIRWIGRRSYAGRFLSANPNVQPIRFRAGSLGAGLPRRDLLVSPEHAMFFDRVLVPARCLVNGSTIFQERNCERVDYFHVELDMHDVLLAEGAPSESFLDDGSRGMFHNASEFAALCPEAAEAGPFYAPRVTDGYELEAIRQRLAMLASEVVLAA